MKTFKIDGMQRIWVFLLVCNSGFAAKTGLQEAYQSAAQKNESVAIKTTEYNASDEKVSQAFGKILPTLNLVGGYTKQDTGASSTISQQFNGDQWNIRANVTQPIFHGLAEFAQYRALKARARSQKSLEKLSRLQLYSSTASVYFDLLLAQADLKTVETLSDLTNKRVKEIQSRTKIGRSKKGDRLSAEAQAMSLNAQVEGAKVSLRQAEENFYLVTGLQKPYDLQAPTDLPEFKVEHSELLKSLENRPDIVSAREEALAAEEGISVARGAHYPQIDAFGNYYFDRTGVQKDAKWDLGVQVTIPLFAGGTIQAAVRENAEIHKGRELNLSYARRNAEKEIRSLSDTLTSTYSQYKLLKEAADLSDLNYKEQSKDYRYGLVSNLEVLQAMNTLQETKRSMDKTFYTALKTYASLNAAIGKHPFEKE